MHMFEKEEIYHVSNSLSLSLSLVLYSPLLSSFFFETKLLSFFIYGILVTSEHRHLNVLEQVFIICSCLGEVKHGTARPW